VTESKASSRRRRIPTLVLALAGAAATLGYGLAVARMQPNAELVMLALGGFALTLCAVAFYRMLDPLLRPEAAPTGGPLAEPARLRELEREKQAVLKAIREIELDFQMRKISEADHKEMTQRYRARAMRLIRELDAGDDYRTLIEQELKHRLSAMAAVKEVSCASCGTQNDPDALYCKKCGKMMGGA
jgi:ribosomal protein L40E